MNKKQLSERDICTKFITPAVAAAGWDPMSQLREEVSFTRGRVIVRGKTVFRGKANARITSSITSRTSLWPSSRRRTTTALSATVFSRRSSTPTLSNCRSCSPLTATASSFTTGRGPARAAHRGSAAEDSDWREILEYFSSATQIGMTATPKATKYVSNIDYFGKPRATPRSAFFVRASCAPRLRCPTAA